MVNQPIKLSSDIVISCPETGFALRKAEKCMACEFFNGFVVAGKTGKVEDDFHVSCKRPITRRMQRIVME